MEENIFYKRNLPHWQPSEERFFVTYRLAGSLPLSVINKLKADYMYQKLHSENESMHLKNTLRDPYFELFEQALEKNLNEPHWLRNKYVAEIVFNSLLFNNNKQYLLWASCLMSNHVHVLLETLSGSPRQDVILQNHKKYTAVQSNKVLDRTGQFWAEESFDTLIRNDRHFYNTANYIIQNPVKAGLVKSWDDWKWTYLHPELNKEFLLNREKH